MTKYNFFNPTAKYKRYLLLSTIEKGDILTQREIAKKLNIAPSMVNMYLADCLNNGLVEKITNSKKDVKYHITDKGISEKKTLNIEFLKSTLSVYNLAKNNITPLFDRLKKSNIKNIVFYGAGEVCDLLLHLIHADRTLDLNVLYLVDDNPIKQDTILSDTKVFNPTKLKEDDYDAVVISSYTNTTEISNRLNELNINNNKIYRLLEGK